MDNALLNDTTVTQLMAKLTEIFIFVTSFPGPVARSV
jgi:hypothetical protein